MVTAVRSAWREVPSAQVRRFAALALQEVPALAQEIFREIRREYPQLPLVPDESGEPRALVGIRQSLEHFVGHLTAGPDRPHVHPRVFQEFGRGEGIQGRSLDVLQAIYRLGVRLAWRRLAEIGQQVAIPAPAMYELAESGFEYLDGLVAESVRGYAEAAARQAGERLRMQRRLMDQLFAEPVPTADEGRPRHRDATAHAPLEPGGPPPPASPPPSPRGPAPAPDHGDPRPLLAERAHLIGWPLPERVAVAVLLRPDRGAVAPAVADGILLDMEC
ncbi:PucR family transcriptional regulator, partial [Streptomyces noursei]